MSFLWPAVFSLYLRAGVFLSRSNDATRDSGENGGEITDLSETPRSMFTLLIHTISFFGHM